MRLKNFAKNGIVLSERSALRLSQFLRRSIDNYLTCYFELEYVDAAIAEDAMNIVFSGKGHVSDGIFERQKALVKETDSTTVALAGSLRYVKFRLSQLFIQGPGEDSDDCRREFDSLSELANEVEADLSRCSTSYRKQQDWRRVNAARVKSLLPDKVLLVEYLKYNHLQPDPDSSVAHYIAAVAANNREPAIINLGEAGRIDSLVDIYRAHMFLRATHGMLLERDLEDYTEISAQLYEAIWLPIEEHVADNDLVLIAPDGALNVVSFAGLTGADGSYLVERFAIHYLSCGRDLIRLEDEVEPARGLFALGDPDYAASASARLSGLTTSGEESPKVTHYAAASNRSGCHVLKETVLSPLPATRDEIERVVAGWRESTNEPTTVCFGVSASEERFKTEAAGNRVIHLATHGFFLGGECQPDLPTRGFDADYGYVGENPLLLSGLFLAGANLVGREADNADAEDGVLTAYEVSAMRLEGTDVVVLSACETALGQVEEGEGVYGLRRAFQMAGARTVISALWPVSDKTTAETMSTLFQREGKTLPGSSARRS